MSTDAIAFFIGLFGSLHCIGMCGPLAFAVPASGNSWFYLVADKLLYNVGRIVSYTALGFIAGLIGRQLWVAGLQQGISLVTGVLIILAGFSRLFKMKMLNGKITAKFLGLIGRLINYAIRHRAGNFFIGILNGFLPCGFVYLALAGAINTSTAVSAAQYMFWFGAGTFPLMLLATLSSALVSQPVRRKINIALPYLMVCLGCWFVLRGLNLNIPYLSPPLQSSGIICH